MIIYNIKDNGSANICVFGEIIGGYDEIAFNDALLAADGEPLDIWLASPGGDLSAAFPMVAALSAYEGKKEIHTCGIVASAATLLLCADGVYVTAHKGSVFMMHQSMSFSVGNADDARKTAEMLDACDDEIVSILMARLGDDEDSIRAMLKSETWLNSKKALDAGLVDAMADAVASGEIAELTEETEKDEPEKPDALAAAIDSLKSVCDSLQGVEAKLDSKLADSVKDTNEKISRISEAISRMAVENMGEQIHFSKPGPAGVKPFELTYNR